MPTMDLEFSPEPWPQRPEVPVVNLKSGYTVSREGREYPGTVFPPDEDMARQEYAVQSSIKYQLQMFGYGRPGQSGEVDFDNMDLTRALALIDEAEAEWLKLPADVRQRYSSWANVERAGKSGELEVFLKTRGAAAVSAAAKGVAASDSAPVEGGEA